MSSFALTAAIPDASRMVPVYTENLPVPSRAVSYPAEEELNRADRIDSPDSFPVPQTHTRGLGVSAAIVPELFLDETDLSQDLLFQPDNLSSHYAQEAATSYAKASTPWMPEVQLIDTYI